MKILGNSLSKEERVSLVNYFRAVQERDAAEAPIRGGRNHHSIRALFAEANERMIAAASEAEKIFGDSK